MKRRTFLHSTILGALAMTDLKDLHRFSEQLDSQEHIMPTVFVGHGNPMNAIEENEFSRGWSSLGAGMPKPSAILCISAHWETVGTHVTAMERPETIHDFYGFPEELFAVRYPAAGSPPLAHQTKELIRSAVVELDTHWGLDHGCWSVVKRMYPNADVPVIQLSLDRTKPAAWHYVLAQELAVLRRKGVLILGSGNMVHNLRVIDWQHPDQGYEWADEANRLMKSLIAEGKHRELANYTALGKAAMMSIPTPEHFLPLLYILALQEKHEEPRFFNDRTLMGSISMTSVRFGELPTSSR